MLCRDQGATCCGLSTHDKCLACMKRGVSCEFLDRDEGLGKPSRLVYREDVETWPEYGREGRAPFKRTKNADYEAATRAAMERHRPASIGPITGGWSENARRRNISDLGDADDLLAAAGKKPGKEAEKEDVAGRRTRASAGSASAASLKSTPAKTGPAKGESEGLVSSTRRPNVTVDIPVQPRSLGHSMFWGSGPQPTSFGGAMDAGSRFPGSANPGEHGHGAYTRGDEAYARG